MLDGMDQEAYKKASKYCHDFMLERKRVVDVMGFGTRRPLYNAYVAIIYVYYIYLIMMAVYGMFLAGSSRKFLIMAAFHVVIDTIFSLWVLTTRSLTDKPLNNIRIYVHSGFFGYQNEEVDVEHERIREKGLADIRSKSTGFFWLYVAGAFTNAFIFPFSQYFIVGKEEYEEIADIANPYLPSFFYIPFSTRNITGFVFAYIINCILPFYANGAAICAIDIYLSTVLQLNTQLRILNYSIRNIHKRAFLMFAKMTDLQIRNMSIEQVYEDSNYQECFYKCLRANIEHHHVLLRYSNEVMKYSRAFLFLVVLIASAAFAANLYVIMQGPAISILINCLLTLIVEQTFALYLCYFGELVMRESEKLFDSLYDVPWFYLNKRITTNLRVFMGYVKKPIIIKSLFLDISASLETYATVLSAMYKIVNLLKQTFY